MRLRSERVPVICVRDVECDRMRWFTLGDGIKDT